MIRICFYTKQYHRRYGNTSCIQYCRNYCETFVNTVTSEPVIPLCDCQSVFHLGPLKPNVMFRPRHRFLYQTKETAVTLANLQVRAHVRNYYNKTTYLAIICRIFSNT